MKINHSKGFTLIELLVVISIIGLLSSVVLAQLQSARDKAKFAKVLATMNSINNTAYLCLDGGSGLTIPSTSGTGGTAVCPATTTTLPDISNTGFLYCGTNCGGWISNSSTGSYAFSVYSDSFSGGRKVVGCGSEQDVGGWYAGTVPNGFFNFTGLTACKKWGF